MELSMTQWWSSNGVCLSTYSSWKLQPPGGILEYPDCSFRFGLGGHENSEKVNFPFKYPSYKQHQLLQHHQHHQHLQHPQHQQEKDKLTSSYLFQTMVEVESIFFLPEFVWALEFNKTLFPLWQNSKTQIVTKQNKNLIGGKLKKWNCEKTKIKQIVKEKKVVKKF